MAKFLKSKKEMVALLVLSIVSCFIMQASCQYYEVDEDEEDDEDPESTTPGGLNATTTPNSAYVVGQINNIWANANSLNITGVVDQALGIRNNQEVRTMVNGILQTVFCNPFFSNYNNCGKRPQPSVHN